MTIEVFGFGPSPFTGLVLMSLWEKEADFEFVIVDIPSRAHKQPAHLQMQPFGQMPYIKDGDYSLFESRAIVSYIADKFSGQGTELYPKDPKVRGHVNQWLDVLHHNYFTITRGIVAEKFYPQGLLGRPGDETKVQENVKNLEAVLDIYEAHLSKHNYLAGDGISLADLSHFGPTLWLLRTYPEGVDIYKSRKHVYAWWKELSSRPSCKQYVELANALLPKTDQ